jgi:hypothetical protein
MLGGKIGNLAKEIAEETAGDLDIDLENGSSVNDVFQKLFKNPAKLMDLVKNVGGKLDDKIKNGDIKESELLEEASDFINNMKNVPGMGNLESLFKKMGVPGANATGGKMDLGAMQRQMEENMKQAIGKGLAAARRRTPPPSRRCAALGLTAGSRRPARPAGAPTPWHRRTARRSPPHRLPRSQCGPGSLPLFLTG